jgi:N6-adenosine-specific RNA methylase IME4
MSYKFNLIVSDPAWKFSDTLQMSKVKRGAEDQYLSVMSNEDICNLLPIELVADDAVLALWVPSSLLQVGLDVMKAWGFEQKQTVVWVKIKLSPLEFLINAVKKNLAAKENPTTLNDLSIFSKECSKFNLTNILNFGMGRLFRNVHELLLIGTRGKMYQHVKNKSQRTVHFAINEKHSKKPEILQEQLEIMFPDPNLNKLELFARRSRKGWICLGNENKMTEGEDLRKSLKKLSLDFDLNHLLSLPEEEMTKMWSQLGLESQPITDAANIIA